jgi:hypothetical protein
MIPDFKGHHFVEDALPHKPASLHHCERCGMKAVTNPDGSIDFHVAPGLVVMVSGEALLVTSVIRPCSGPLH